MMGSITVDYFYNILFVKEAKRSLRIYLLTCELEIRNFPSTSFGRIPYFELQYPVDTVGTGVHVNLAARLI